MPIRLDARAPDFAERFRAFLATKREAAADVEAVVRAILADVAERGDAALIELTAKHDRLDLAAGGLKITAAEIETAYAACEQAALDALAFARDRIEAYHRRQLPRDERFTDALGVELGHRWTAIEAVGLYVPGGTAAYPSSVLMNAVPAKVAGVPRIVMVVPSPAGKLNPLVLAAARLAGVDEIYRIGGAQAVAALAYGTATIRAVAKIVGPGNAYVAAAKRLVFGRVGIDMIAGPSEVLILADATGQADWIAADLLAQAEHDPSAQSILITDDPALAGRVEAALAAQLETLPRAAVAAASWRDFGAIILVGRSPTRCRSSTPSRPSTWRSPPPIPSAWRADPQCRRDLSRPPYPGGDRRLCGGLQSRVADGALGALLLRSRRARFHEAHLHSQMRARSAARARQAPRSRSGRPRASMRMPARWRCASIRDDRLAPRRTAGRERAASGGGDAGRQIDRPLRTGRGA